MCIIRFPRDGSEIVFCGQNEGGRVVVAVYKAIGAWEGCARQLKMRFERSPRELTADDEAIMTRVYEMINAPWGGAAGGEDYPGEKSEETEARGNASE